MLLTIYPYDDLNQSSVKCNTAKLHEERIGKAKGKPNVKYVVYPNGKVMVYIACSDTPFKLETEANEGLLFSCLVGTMRFLNDLNPKQSILL
jgi:hypothetical protein